MLSLSKHLYRSSKPNAGLLLRKRCFATLSMTLFLCTIHDSFSARLAFPIKNADICPLIARAYPRLNRQESHSPPLF